jgi:hypothetical protein
MIGRRHGLMMRCVAVLATGGAPVWMFSPGAGAKIRCEGPYQITNGASIATPYCEAENLARVAQSRGISVSAAAIRGSYSTLKRVCMSLHGDSRVSGTCDQFTGSLF